MMKEFVFKFTMTVLVFTAVQVKLSLAQISAGKQGLYVLPGTILSVQGLYLIPSADFSITENSLNKRSLSVSGSTLNGVAKIFEFGTPVGFNGSVGFFYLPDELNGNQADGLRLAYSHQISTDFKEFSVIDEAEHDRQKGLLTNQLVKIPSLSSLTALTPPGLLLPGGKIEPSNFLTPNQDGLNDVWVIKGIENYPLNELKIYDRTGRLIYNTSNYNNTWDGTYNGRPLAEDSYYFILYLIKEQKQLTGFISLVKEE